MDQNIFSPMQLDAIGEIMNISLGSSATAVSNMLDHRVDITTPSVTVVPVEEFSLGELEPAIGIEIKYVSGLEGSNIMLLKRNDVKVIVDMMMGMETPDEEFELSELAISAVCELMNQMMGAASTALSDFLGRSVNISTPRSFMLENLEEFKNELFKHGAGPLVEVRFMLGIESVLKSEFVNVMSVDLAKELLAGFGMGIEDMGPENEALPAPESPPAAASSDRKLSQEEIERLMGGGASASTPAPAAASSDRKLSQEEIERLMGGGASASTPAPASEPSGGKLSQEEIERLMSGGASAPAPAPVYAPQQPVYPQQPDPMAAQPPVYQQPMYQQSVYQQPVYQQPAPKLVNAQPFPMPALDVADKIGQEQAQNLELIMSVPLEVSVEIGRTRRKVEDILTFSKGSLVVLDKLAGDQVDLFVNGMCVARGDVVVIDDNFGIRITEVLKKPGLQELVQSK